MIYHYTAVRTICLLFTIVEVTNAFVLHDTRKSSALASFSLASTVDDTSKSEVPIAPRSSSNKMSQALPFLKCPPILAENMDVPGNVGFDPLGFVQDKEDLITYQEAEIKHARLAMLAAVGWPLSELWNARLADAWNLPTILASDDRVPAVLNSNFGSVSPIFWGFCLGASAAIDKYAILKSRDATSLTYFPGNLGFDPLGLLPVDKDGQLRMRLAEIKHGRLAMIAISGFALQEFVSKVGVIDQTPLFFHPFAHLE